ncbi:hypothetical protein BAUCODRAFT_408646 [Baudoinia panamericana UAMH 10762]|uniref:Uncharacterized protein n=1 Tax=Baudoinia panamericana (strain UAMH 10762) TaxID=717646 RepID=M2NFC1_BAUPA|nr:uncharacterized protein BAUCODRAFT_408646 [Baudoinia panamericana UAMH 10762]EMC97944.1 hypothetical protein BAUCODRAFT_408646 [Baudoinia panamericana UAMH 10762]
MRPIGEAPRLVHCLLATSNRSRMASVIGRARDGRSRHDQLKQRRAQLDGRFAGQSREQAHCKLPMTTAPTEIQVPRLSPDTTVTSNSRVRKVVVNLSRAVAYFRRSGETGTLAILERRINDLSRGQLPVEERDVVQRQAQEKVAPSNTKSLELALAALETKCAVLRLQLAQGKARYPENARLNHHAGLIRTELEEWRGIGENAEAEELGLSKCLPM